MEALLGVDWREAWRKHYALREAPGDSTCWDSRSQEYGKNSGQSSYAHTFLQYLDVAPHESILDMGCGPGVLALPLARLGNTVLAADFSQGMCEEATSRAQEEGLQNLRVLQLDWNDDWLQKGIQPKSVDVAIASRSTIVSDLAESLLKLNQTARRKVAVTMATEYSPKGYRPLGSKQENCNDWIPDYIFGVNILLQLGAYPELRYIDSWRGNSAGLEKELVRWAYISWKPIP